MEVDSASDILDEFVTRIRLLEFVDLSSEVRSLMFGTDSSVDNFRFRDGGLLGIREDSIDIIDGVESFTTNETFDMNITIFSPTSKGRVGDAKLVSNEFGSDELSMTHGSN